MQLSESGYENLGPLGSMLSCALGFSEVEFARIKDRGKAYEEQFFEKIFPRTEGIDEPHGEAVLKRIKEIFNAYELDTDFSFSKKRSNQKLLNEMYSECLKLMQKRIENEVQRGNIKDLETYKNDQKF